MKGVGKLNEEDYRLAKRAKRFSQMETDLLLSIVMTNRMTSKGRSMEWEQITISFNASPGVVQRTEKELRERTSNIRKDLYKLSRFQKDSTQATGGGHLPPRKPPSVSFELSESVKKYAVSLQVKLAGLAPVDSDRVSHLVDETTSTPSASRTFNLFNSEVVATPALTVGTLETTVPSHDEIAMPSTSTQSQRRHKLNTEGSSNSNSSTSMTNSVTKSSSAAQTYLENKSKLLADESQRRKEWHNLCMKIKNEELAIKRKQSQFWSLIVNDVKRNQTNNITDIVARAMEITNPINYDARYPNGQSFSAFEQNSPLIANEAHAEQSDDDVGHAENYGSLCTLSPVDVKAEEEEDE